MTASIVTALPYKNCYFSRNLMHRSGIVKSSTEFCVLHTALSAVLKSGLHENKLLKSKLNWIQKKTFPTVEFTHRCKQITLKLTSFYFHNLLHTPKGCE